MRVHFIGIKGVSMSFLSELVKMEGIEVSGSDLRISGHRAENVRGADAVVYSLAIKDDNPEYAEAKRLNIPLLSRSELLGKISLTYKDVVAMAGTHGKTTTVAMLMSALKDSHPTVHMGGTVAGKAGAIGSKRLFITEACEYKRSFLSLSPTVGIVLNIDLDHADCYKNLDSVREAFGEFCRNSQTAIVCGDNEARILKGGKSTITFGMNETNDYRAVIVGQNDGCYIYDALFHGKDIGRVRLSVHGKHNVLDSLAAVAYCHYTGQSFDGISQFKGVDRRFESLYKSETTEYISDYAHHPREIECTLIAAKSIFKRVLTVFEPHTYSRTLAFYREFAAALSLSDEVILLPIYAAREAPVKGVDSSLIAKEGGFECASSYAQAAKMIKGKKVDAVIFMGAGSVDDFARDYVEKLQ